jgi:diadenosine tetraphosphate (Ap4A) HIT family hydrolase
MPERPPVFPRKALDRDAYEDRVRNGPCFICGIVSGNDPNGNQVIYRDEVSIAWLNKLPTLVGYALLAPLEHRTDVVAGFDEAAYVALQRRVHWLGRAVSEVVPMERLYLLSLGSHQGNSHVHWHVAPLPPGVPYRQQQYGALTGLYLDIPEAYQEQLAAQIGDAMRRIAASAAKS